MKKKSSSHAQYLLADTLLSPQTDGLIAGIDEAGRGCLAGPVVAAAVILPDTFDLPGLTDSKALSAARRERLAIQIKKQATTWAVSAIWAPEIDTCNILQATLRAMAKAASKLKQCPARLLIDGNITIPTAILEHFCAPQHTSPLPHQQAIIKGDALIPAISAASILAKTFRDTIMLHLGKRYPAYGFADHKGYGTQAHLTALRAFGPCPQHRKTFAGVLPSASPNTMQQGQLC